MKRDCYPIEIALPDGRRAEYVAGTRPPRYTVDGQACAIDVTIPDDLAQAGWYWSGSFLYQPWPEARTDEQGRGPGVAISTALHGPPGYACERPTCFEVAQRMERRRLEHTTITAAPPKKVKAITKTASQPELAQAMMEF